LSDIMKPTDPFEVRAGERVRVTETHKGVTQVSEYVVEHVTKDDSGGHVWDLPDGTTRYWGPVHPNGSPAHLVTVEVEVQQAKSWPPATTGHAERILKWRSWNLQDSEGEWGVWIHDGDFITMDGRRHHPEDVQGFEPDHRDLTKQIHELIARRYMVSSDGYNRETARMLASLTNSTGA
jgi:hypothetical protein